ncbi:MAG TPA: haloacid dehalogenase type II [Candidatus Limnocylindrales bacterium]|nr:haloacid dehalogenase type II [Candidatus Limnocylindrales bacterium]
MSDLDYGRFEALTFDCYGTLIDWETGIVAALRRVLGDAGTGSDDDELLGAFAASEAPAEAGPYRRYRDILALAAHEVSARFGVEPDVAAVTTFADSVGDWPAFPDSAAALARLHQRFRLGVITNCDDDLFARSATRLGTTFDWVVTAQQAGRYKPDERPFEIAFERIGLPRERILHVAQSLFHDHVTARRLGLSTVWIDRRAGRPGGATPRASAAPDARFVDMASFAEAATRPDG